LLGFPPGLLIANELVPFDSKQCSQSPLIKSVNLACIHQGGCTQDWCNSGATISNYCQKRSIVTDIV